MITHVVLFKFPDGADVDGVVERLRSMEGQVPTLRQLEVGRDINRSERAWDICLLTRFDSREGLAEYQDHPFHRDVASFMASQDATSAVVDWSA